jgi:hypothetical protein
MNHQMILAAIACAALAGCDGSDYASSAAKDSQDNPAARDAQDGAAARSAVGTAPGQAPAARSVVETTPRGFVAHEWGTFTSVVGSDGGLLEGLHHEEEALPAFVYGRAPISNNQTKRVEALPEGVTQKMETPVIYFYAPEPMDVSVTVDFPQGVLSEWYPAATSFGPEIGALTRIADGTMKWDVHLEHTDKELIEVHPEDIWAPSREVPQAATVSAGDEHERFIFYRGLARFETKLRVTADAQNVVHVHNDSSQNIPAAFLLHVHEGGGSIVPLGAVGPGLTISASPSPKESPGEYEDIAAAAIAEALEASGLYRDEALSMVNTWRRSYFGNPGLRVLYILPSEWTDALLPLRITPVPDEVVRTLVGRVEVLTPAEEAQIVLDVEASRSQGTYEVGHMGRFAEPKLRRALDLVGPETRPWVEQMLAAQAPQMP